MSASSLAELIARTRDKRKELEARSGRKVKPIKPKPGRTRWRILPGWRKEDPYTFYHEFAEHWIKDDAGEVLAVYICAKKTFGKDCEICDMLQDAIAGTTDDSMLKRLTEAKSKAIALVNALPVGDSSADENTPVLLGLPISALDKFLALIDQRATEDGIDMLSLKEGRDIIIERIGTGLNTEYNVFDAAKNRAVPDSVMEKVTNLDEYVAQEIEEKKKKALAALAAVSGNRSLAKAAARPALAAPSTAPAKGEDWRTYDGEVVPPTKIAPDMNAKAEAAKPVETPEPTVDFDAPLPDEDLEKMLAELK